MKKDRPTPARNLRAVILLLPLLAVVSWIVWQVARPKVSVGSSPAVNETNVSVAARRGGELTGTQASPRELESSAEGPIFRQRGADAAPTDDATNDFAREVGSPAGVEPPARKELFDFDPNTVSYHDLVRLGFTSSEALGIVKYRQRGKVFQIPEDLAACRQVSEAMYRRLEPYIIIGEQFRLRPFAQTPSFEKTRNAVVRGSDSDSHHSPAPAAGEMSAREFQPAAGHGGDVQSRSNRSSGFSSPHTPSGGAEGFSEARSFSPIPVNLNSADSVTLLSVRGIGSLTAGRIVEYRRRLGGFVRASQLAEIRGMTEQNFERILPNIFIDTTLVTKININFAPASQLAAHPYVGDLALRKLLKMRQLKGGWRTVDELKEENILGEQELERLRPYLSF